MDARAGSNHRVIGEVRFGPRLRGLELDARSFLSEHFRSPGLDLSSCSCLVASMGRRVGTFFLFVQSAA